MQWTIGDAIATDLKNARAVARGGKSVFGECAKQVANHSQLDAFSQTNALVPIAIDLIAYQRPSRRIPLPQKGFGHRIQCPQQVRGEARKMPPASAVIDGPKSHARSQVTNGTAVLPGIDGRSTWVRRLRDLIRLHLGDIGGPDLASEAEKSIIRRASAVTVELERLELRFAEANLAGQPPDPVDFDLYLRGANSLRRLLEAVGIKRIPKDVTPKLSSYLAGAHTEAAE